MDGHDSIARRVLGAAGIHRKPLGWRTLEVTSSEDLFVMTPSLGQVYDTTLLRRCALNLTGLTCGSVSCLQTLVPGSCLVRAAARRDSHRRPADVPT